jgi:hypothetical protein
MEFIFSQDVQKAIIVIILCPLIWNVKINFKIKILARIEYSTKLFTKIFLNTPKYGCYAFATWIFFFSIYRDYV